MLALVLAAEQALAALREELACGLQLVTTQPAAGAVARNVRLTGVRRIPPGDIGDDPQAPRGEGLRPQRQ
ncbi:MAG: hypothetical protein ABL971_00230 [Vicinamibacterales bacterium]